MNTNRQALPIATALGAIALLIWALSACIAANLINIPTFQILSISLCLAGFFTLIKLTVQRRWHTLKGQPLLLWLVCLVGTYGNDVTYISASKFAPAEQADMLSYIWPVMAVFMICFMTKKRVQTRYIVSAVLGFLGIYILLTNGQGFGHFESKYTKGYLLAALDAFTWCIFSVLTSKHEDSPSELIGICCGISGLLSLVTHSFLEPTVMPTLGQWGFLLFMGVASSGCAYYFWDTGMKRGNFYFLTNCAYLTPLLSSLMLVLLGITPGSLSLFIAAVLVTLSAFISTVEVDWRRLFKTPRASTVPPIDNKLF